MTSGPARASIVAAVVALLAGIALAVFGVVHIVRDVVHTVNAPIVTLPAHVVEHLDTGDYDIYQRTGTRQGGNGFNFRQNGSVSLTPADVSVSGTDGSRLGVGAPTVNETITRGDAVFTAAVRFSVLQAGTYVIDVQAPFGGSGEQAIITKSFGNIARSAVPSALVVLAGGLLALVSIVVLIVLLVRSRRQRGPALGVPAYAGAGAAQPAAPPGWYPDPSGQAPHRWWDGTRWTDHTG